MCILQILHFLVFLVESLLNDISPGNNPILILVDDFSFDVHSILIVKVRLGNIKLKLLEIGSQLIILVSFLVILVLLLIKILFEFVTGLIVESFLKLDALEAAIAYL